MSENNYCILFPCFFQETNLARGGIATQSSQLSFGSPRKAIDGRRTSNWRQGSCTHTRRQYKPWWRLDLRTAYKVNYVKITNRKDCCAERLNGAEIHIGNSLSDNGNRNPRYINYSSTLIVLFAYFVSTESGTLMQCYFVI